MSLDADALSLATQVLRGGRASGEPGSPVVTPLTQSANYLLHAGTDQGLIYPRYGNAPNADLLQRRLAAIEGTEAALVLSSGMGATACALLALLRPGDHLLASKWIYGGVRRFFQSEFPSMGIDVTFVDPMETRGWRKRLRKETRAIFVETPTNPTCRVLDLRPISALTLEVGLALVVDSTFASPVNIQPVRFGADVVIHSATKYLNGHNDVISGVVCGTASYIEEVRQKMILWGQSPDPFACWLLERGLKTLDVRVHRQNANALQLATWLSEQPEVAKVHYPGLSTHPDHETAKTTMHGFGGMLAFELKAGGPAAERLLSRVRVVTHASSLGGVESLACEPRFTSHAHLTAEERRDVGIPDGFVRLSVGIESPYDLIADLDQALHGPR
ncbi:MAG: PLP-dependent aspartate aminotransferase family protein [Gemmatimonadaceae bacterium]